MDISLRHDFLTFIGVITKNSVITSISNVKTTLSPMVKKNLTIFFLQYFLFKIISIFASNNKIINQIAKVWFFFLKTNLRCFYIKIFIIWELFQIIFDVKLNDTPNTNKKMFQNRQLTWNICRPYIKNLILLQLLTKKY